MGLVVRTLTPLRLAKGFDRSCRMIRQRQCWCLLSQSMDSPLKRNDDVDFDDKHASRTDVSDDLISSKTDPPATVTTQNSDPHATPSQARGRDLYYASRHGDLVRVKRMLAAGHVDINARVTGGKTPLMVAAQWGQRDVVEFLVGRGADVSLVDEDGDSFLHLACEREHLETVKLILSLDKVDVNTRDKHGKTAADYARLYGSQQLLDLLVSRGAH